MGYTSSLWNEGFSPLISLSVTEVAVKNNKKPSKWPRHEFGWLHFDPLWPNLDLCEDILKIFQM